MLIQNLFENILIERHLDITQALEPYRNDDNIFVSFTDDVGETSHRVAGKKTTIGRNVSGAKLGINPKSPYDTPVGIYSYPLKLIWDRLIKDTIPFASDRKYLQLFRGRGNIVNLSEMTAAEYEDYAEKLRLAFDGSFRYPGNIENWNVFKFRVENVGVKANKPGGHFWALCYRIAGGMGREGNPSSPSARWNNIMRTIGIEGCRDNGDGIIHENEPTQAVFFSIQSVALVETLPNVRKGSAPAGLIRTFKSLDYLTDWLNANNDDEVSAAKMIAAQLPALLTTGKSKNFRLADGVLETLTHPEDFITSMMHWRGGKGIVPALELMRSPKFSTPECANAVVQGLLSGRKASDAMRLMASGSAAVLAQALGKDRRATVMWIGEKIATKAIFEYAFNNPVEGFSIEDVMGVIGDEVGKDKATLLRSLLGDERLLKITQIAEANFPY